MAEISRDHWVGAGVRYIRTLRGMSLQHLADEIGRSNAYVSRIEKGHTPAKTGDLMAFAHVLGVELEALKNPPRPVGFDDEDNAGTVSSPSGPYANIGVISPPENVVELDAKGTVLAFPTPQAPEPTEPASARVAC